MKLECDVDSVGEIRGVCVQAITVEIMIEAEAKYVSLSRSLLLIFEETICCLYNYSNTRCVFFQRADV